MPQWDRIAEGVCLVGGPEISRADDATVFLIDGGDALALIDSGAGRSVRRIESNIREAGYDPAFLLLLLLLLSAVFILLILHLTYLQHRLNISDETMNYHRREGLL